MKNEELKAKVEEQNNRTDDVLDEDELNAVAGGAFHCPCIDSGHGVDVGEGLACDS